MPTKIFVRSNVDALSERRLHEALVDMVDDSTHAAGETLRADRAAHSRSGLTLAHLRSERAHEVAGMIEARIGVTPVTEKDARRTHGRYRHSQAPIFVEEGTHTPIFSAREGLMWNRREGIFGRRAVRGQHPQRFMAKAYAEAQLLMRADKHVELALAEMAAEARAIQAEMEL